MDDYPLDDASLADEDSAFEALQELESQTPDEIRRQRAHDRLAIKAAVTLQSGDSSRLRKSKVQGITGDISTHGCCAMFPTPIGVGNVYRLQFDHEDLNIPLVFARCMRCQLVREDSFEAGFKFFSAVDLSVTTENLHADLLI